MNKSDETSQNPDSNYEVVDPRKSSLERAKEKLKIAVDLAYADDVTEKNARLSVSATEYDLVRFAASSETASFDEILGRRIWRILVANSSKYAGNFQGQFVYEEAGSAVEEIHLTERLIEVARTFEGMGPKSQAALEAYFKFGLTELDEATSTPEK